MYNHCQSYLTSIYRLPCQTHKIIDNYIRDVYDMHNNVSVSKVHSKLYLWFLFRINLIQPGFVVLTKPRWKDVFQSGVFLGEWSKNLVLYTFDSCLSNRMKLQSCKAVTALASGLESLKDSRFDVFCCNVPSMDHWSMAWLVTSVARTDSLSPRASRVERDRVWEFRQGFIELWSLGGYNLGLKPQKFMQTDRWWKFMQRCTIECRIEREGKGGRGCCTQLLSTDFWLLTTDYW